MRLSSIADGGRESHRTAYIDGLRAVAVLAVVASHAAINKNSGWRLGAHGIDLFFVISGFCLAYPTLRHLYERGQSQFDVALFAAHRITRILPPYYIAIALLLGVVWLFRVTQHQLPPPEYLSPATGSDILHQMLFFDGQVQFTTQTFWTLAVEFRWYLFFPIALLLWVRSPRAFVALIVLAVISAATRLANLDLTILPAFLLGIIAADIRVRFARIAPFALLAFIPLLSWAVWLQPPYIPGTNFFHPAWQLSAFALVVAGALPVVRAALSFRPFALIGTASYSVYLVHLPAIGIAEEFGCPPLLSAGIGVAAGVAFWYVAERPLLSSAIRGRMVVALREPLTRWLGYCGITHSVTVQQLLPKSLPEAEALESVAANR